MDCSTPASLSFTISWSLLKFVSIEGFPGGSDGKESTCNAGDLSSIPGLGRSPEGKRYPLQYSGLENSMDCIVHGVTKSWIWLTGFHFHLFYSWLCWVFIAVQGLSLVVASGGYSLLQCVGFSLWWLLLQWFIGCRYSTFNSCSARAQLLHIHGLSS